MDLDIIDVNTWLGCWPFQYFHEDSPARLAAHLETEGIAAAFVGSPETAFNPDSVKANRILLKRLSAYPKLHAVMTVNPVIGDWRELLAAYRDQGAAAVRLIPGYHCYSASSSELLGLVEDIAAAGDLLLFMQVRMEDERTHHPLCQIPAFECGQIIELATRFPEMPIVVLCAHFHEAVQLLTETTNVYTDISYVERMRTLPSLLTRASAERVLFGSHTPFLYTRSAIMKLEAPGVPETSRKAIASVNIQRLLGPLL